MFSNDLYYIVLLSNIAVKNYAIRLQRVCLSCQRTIGHTSSIVNGDPMVLMTEALIMWSWWLQLPWRGGDIQRYLLSFFSFVYTGAIWRVDIWEPSQGSWKFGSWLAWFYGVSRHFQQYFSYIVAVSFIHGGNRKTRSNPPTYRKLLTNFIT
jgi:hypothetical protein